MVIQEVCQNKPTWVYSLKKFNVMIIQNISKSYIDIICIVCCNASRERMVNGVFFQISIRTTFNHVKMKRIFPCWNSNQHWCIKRDITYVMIWSCTSLLLILLITLIENLYDKMCFSFWLYNSWFENIFHLVAYFDFKQNIDLHFVEV